MERDGDLSKMSIFGVKHTITEFEHPQLYGFTFALKWCVLMVLPLKKEAKKGEEINIRLTLFFGYKNKYMLCTFPTYSCNLSLFTM